MDLLSNKVALVTGGSRGIGRAIALEIASEGADVAITFRENEQEAARVTTAIQELGCRALAVKADAADFSRAQEVIGEVVRTLGHLDILVNNAGLHRNQAIWDMSVEAWDTVLDVSLKGAFNYMHAVADVFRQQGSGKIVSISSIHGLRGREAGPNYSAAKAGLIGLSKSVARDLGQFGVNVNVVAPGIVETDMVRSLAADVKNQFVSQIVLGRIGQPEDVAHMVTFLCTDKARHITGEVIKVDGGQYI
jgi:3-oxoacyl-[acyl-carrier protein] reductase